MDNKDEMKEGMYLDAMNQLQKKFDENEEKISELVNMVQNLKKEIISAYGVMRLIDNYIDPTNIDYSVKTLIDCLRGFLSDLVEQMDTSVVVVPVVEVDID
tara:strand:+ start:2694 stop:2996 length:303 start_codon:yes stop_codon:yes gene_type:complete